MMIEGSEEKEKEEEGGQEAEDELNFEVKAMRLALKSLLGLTSNKSFKVWGKIRGQEVVVMIDTGALTNFISKRLVEQLRLLVEESPVYNIEVGNGQQEKGQGVCKELEMEIQGREIKQHFFILELGGTDVILGMDWLASLGKIEADFQHL